MSEKEKEVLTPNVWSELISGFATAVGKTTEEVENALKPVLGDPGDEALELLSDVVNTTDAMLRDAFKDLAIPAAKLNKNIALLRGIPTDHAVVTNGTYSVAVLPKVPDDTSFTEMLKVGGISKVGDTELVAAVRAAIANKLGSYDLPKLILDLMDRFAIAQEMPYSEDYYALKNILVERNYADLMKALGIKGSIVTEASRKEFLNKVEQKLWPAISSFHEQLKAWEQAWNSSANPMAMFTAMAHLQNGGGVMPPGMMSPPDASHLRAAAEEVINEINRIFAGPGIVVSRALASDVIRIKKVLEDPKILAQTGMATREQLLKEIAVVAGADMVRAESSMTQYCLAVLSLPKVSAADEVLYLGSMLQLGASIPWAKFTGSGIGRNFKL